MPSLTLPLLSPPTTTTPDIPPPTPKKTPKKLRRKNPPPSLTTTGAHQRLPSSAGSSTYSRPSSSKSNPPDHQTWTASSHPASQQQGGRGSEPRAGDWSARTADFPSGPPPALPAAAAAALYSGLVTPPPESELRQGGRQIQVDVQVQMQGQQSQNQNQNPGASPRSVSSVYSSPPASSNQERFPVNVQQQTPPTPQPPQVIIRGKGRDAFKAFSYDSYNSPSVPPSTSLPASQDLPPPPPLPQILYVPNAQHPNTLFASALPLPPANNSNTTTTTITTITDMHTRSKTLPSNLDLTDLAPPSRIQARTPGGTPTLPPLPSFQSGGFGFDLPGAATAAAANNAINKNDNTAHHQQQKASPTNSGRQKYRPTSLPSPTAPPVPARKRPSMYFHPEPEPAPAPVPVPAEQGEYVCHAITAEEPIALPSSSAEHTPVPSPPTASEEFGQQQHQAPAKGRVRRKSDAVSSFLGGWKLTMMGGGNSSSTARNEKALSSGSESDVSPVGVGDGGGWIHRRKGSFSSTRPPSREKSKYAQEYKEFRAQKAAESATTTKTTTTSLKRASHATSREGSVAPAAPASPVEGTGVSGILGGMATTRERAAEKAKEGRRARRESSGYVSSSSDNSTLPPVPVVDPSKIASASEVVSLDVAVRQMQLLESQLKKGRPLSPPDSRDGEKSESDRGYQASSEYSQTTTAATDSRQGSADSSQQNSGSSSPSGSINQKFQVLPAPSQASSSKQQQISDSTGKGKSRSPLRNEIDSESVSSDEKKKLEQRPKSMGKHSSGGSTIKQQQDYFTRPKSSGGALGSGSGSPGSGSRPTTPPKPIAKLFVICCRCKYWHDLPSVMYRGMVENGGATRCPYCLHGMEVSCCAGYTCVVYMHQKHH